MITVRLIGGLGNQLFQWALGRAILKHRPNVGVQYDPSTLDDDPCRIYLLDKLGLTLPLRRGAPGPMYVEGSLRYRPEALLRPDGDVLFGYWQCEKYFLDIQDEIRSSVFRAMPLSPESQKVGTQIAELGNKSCFVHVRRTDNTTGDSFAVHGLLGMDYYKPAIELVRTKVDGARFFIFSDDPAWARQMFVDADMTVVDCNPMSGSFSDGKIHKGTLGRENEDLFLMSACANGIVANSSFSWWGAWLNPAEKSGMRIVVAPVAWFSTGHQPGARRLDSSDILPARWVRL